MDLTKLFYPISGFFLIVFFFMSASISVSSSFDSVVERVNSLGVSCSVEPVLDSVSISLDDNVSFYCRIFESKSLNSS